MTKVGCDDFKRQLATAVFIYYECGHRRNAVGTFKTPACIIGKKKWRYYIANGALYRVALCMNVVTRNRRRSID